MIPSASLPGSSTTWRKTRWRGESAWCAENGPVLAVVTEVRCRLIYLGAIDGTANLLNAPYPRQLPGEQNRWPNQGGHRFWLGPQKTWVWPPPTEWEFASAISVSVADGVLTLHQPQLDPAYPAIHRDYEWDDGRLRCTARWCDGDRAFFGMHVVPVDLPFRGGASLRKTESTPLGFVEVTLEGARSSGFLPHPSVTTDDAHATLHDSRRVIKAGFPAQSLTIERAAGWQLTVSPGPHEGAAGEAPDQNCLSQIWVGGPEHDLAELEQLTPYLRGDAQGCCASTIYLAAVPPRAG